MKIHDMLLGQQPAMECTIDGLLFMSNFDSGNLAHAEKAVKEDEDGTKQPSPVASGFCF